MALSSKITVNIKAIVDGLPEVKQLTHELNQLKGTGLQANLFAGIGRAGPALAGMAGQMAALNTNAKGLGHTLKIVNKDAAGGLSSVTLSQNVSKAAKGFAGLNLSMKETSAAFGPLSLAGSGASAVLVSVAKGAAVAAAAIAALGTAIATVVFTELVDRGTEFNKLMETSKTSVAAILATATDLFKGGQQLTGLDAVNAGLAIAEGTMARLQASAVKLGISFEGVARAFTEGLGPGLQSAGLSLQQLEELIPKIALAAQTIGLPVDQFAQEVRAIFSGDIDREARVARLLQIDAKDIADFKGKADELFKFLSDKLRGFEAAGPVVAKTLTGSMAIFIDAVNRAAGQATEGLFASFKVGLQQAFQDIVDTTTGQFTEPVQNFINLINNSLTELGNFLVELIVKVTGFFNDLMKDTASLSEIMGSIKGIIVGTFNVIKAMIANLTNGQTRTQALASAFKFVFNVVKGIAFAVALIFDVIVAGKGIVQGLLSVVALGVRGVLEPFRGFSDTIDGILDRMLEWSQSMAKASVDTFRMKSVSEQVGKAFDDAFDTGKVLDFSKAVKQTVTDIQLKNKPLVPDDEKKGKKGRGTEAEPASEREKRSAERALLKAQAEATRRIEEANLDKRQTLLDRFYEESLISTNDYYQQRGEIIKRRGELETQAIQEQIDGQRQAITDSRDELQEQIARIEADTEEKNKPVAIDNARIKQSTEELRIKAEIAKLEGQLAAQQAQTGTEQLNNTNERIRALESLEDRIKSIKQTLAETKGDEQTQFLLRQLEVQKEIIRLRKEGENAAAQALEEQLRLDGDKLLLERQAIELRREQQRLEIEIQTIRNQVAKGEKDPVQAEQEIIALTRQRNKEMITTLELARDIALSMGDIDTALEIEGRIAELNGNLQETSDIAKEMNGVFMNAFTGFFDALITGSKTAGDAFKDMVKGILQGLAQIITKMLLMKILSSIFKAGTGPGGALASLMGFAGGGLVRGPGSATSDSIPARLSAGEYVINARAVRLFGTSFLDQINSGKMRGFAEGGVVTSVPEAAANPNVMVKNVNVFDPRVLFDALATPRGEKLFLNFVTRNRTQMRGILG